MSRPREVLDFIIEFRDENGYPPTVREIGYALDISSPATVHHYLRYLEDMGLISRVANSPRAITVTPPPIDA